uniref:Uncharacterized protein n=1 Tax=Manihot esculenta TaxID=3983 RepID=A0A2C9VVV9_MANES
MELVDSIHLAYKEIEMAESQSSSLTKPPVSILGISHGHRVFLFGCSLFRAPRASKFAWF